MGSNPTQGSFFFEKRESCSGCIYLPCFDLSCIVHYVHVGTTKYKTVIYMECDRSITTVNNNLRFQEVHVYTCTCIYFVSCIPLYSFTCAYTANIMFPPFSHRQCLGAVLKFYSGPLPMLVAVSTVPVHTLLVTSSMTSLPYEPTPERGPGRSVTGTVL